MNEKIPIHLGLFGHIDSGKTAIAEVLSEVISTAGIDAHPQSKERGITIDLGFTSFVVGNYLVTLVDGPGHADLIKISASSIEIIDCALLVIDINKGPQVQTGEHLIMIEALELNDIIVILNKIDLFRGDVEKQIEKIRNFFKSTPFGPDIPIFVVSAKEKTGFKELEEGILTKIKKLDIKRNYESDIVIPIDHHFSIKGRGAIITGTILRGMLKVNDILHIVPLNMSGRVKSIQIFHKDVETAKAGDRIGINLKGVDIKKIYRGCYATNNKNTFEYSDKFVIKVKKNKLFKPITHFGTQVHLTIGMFSSVGQIFPYSQFNKKKIQKDVVENETEFEAILILNEKVIIDKAKGKILMSRLDLPPTMLRILGAADIVEVLKENPSLYKYKIKKGIIVNPDHSQGIICSGLAQSIEGARKIIGKELSSPFTKIISPFGTKGSVIVGIESRELSVNKGDYVILKELRSFKLKPKKDLNVQN